MNELSKIMDKHGSDKYGLPPWGHNYTPYYDTEFGHLRADNIILLEIGVGGEDKELGGKSLKGWAEYFASGKIYGIDIYDKTALDYGRIKTFQGSQDDINFLNKVIESIGRPHIIIDDGSHVNKLTIESFKILFPRLRAGGLYCIEDLSCAYRWDFGGSKDLNSKDTIMAYLFSMLHNLNRPDIGIADYQFIREFDEVEWVHFYPELAVIKKK